MKHNSEESEWFTNIVRDPALWAETFLRDPTNPQLPLSLRSYQREILEETRDYKNMVLRYGRRMGKCSLDTDITRLATGERLTIKDLWERYKSGEDLKLINLEKDLTVTSSKPILMEDNGLKETFEVRTRSGRKINVTENHPLLRIDGWQPVADLTVGDRILVPSKIDYKTTKEIDDRDVKLLGYLLGDGTIITRVELTNNNISIIEDFETSARKYNVTPKRHYERGCYYSRLATNTYRNDVISMLRDYKLFGKNSHTKFVPNVIFELSKKQQALFLSRLYACDGWAYVSKSNRKSGNCEIGYCSVSEDLIYGVSDLLVRFGIKHFVTEKDVKYNGTLKKALCIYIRTKEDITSFIDQIGIFSKEDACDNVLKSLQERSDIKNGYFYQVPKEAIDLYDIKTPRKYEIRKEYNPSKIKILKAAKDQGINDLINICESDTYFDEIVSITSSGKHQTYAIEVPCTHNYIVGNIITHNTVVFCADALWWTCAQPLARLYDEKGTKQVPLKVLVLTPMDSQIKLIFDTLLELCTDSPFIQELNPKIRRSDVNEISFDNGSVIKGMTIGISSANKGTSCRGQNADYIFLDECDYIPREIMEESILPISNTNPDCKIRACSTPSGKRDLYFEWCTKHVELGWWHRHYPSWHEDNPNWLSIDDCLAQGRPKHESTEFQYRSVMSTEAYEREFGAEFGEENQGVYKHELLDKTMVKYCKEYLSHDTDVFDPGFVQNPGNLYVVGVDWNTYKNGGQVVMVEYCKEPTFASYFDDQTKEDVLIDFTGKFRLFYRRGVKSKQATQRETRAEIIRLMRNYKVDHVYVDYGAGDTNIEELTHYGKDHPALHIRSKLHVVDSGSNIEHYDPVLKTKVKKRAKSMMINTSVVCLEEGRLLLPREEDSNHRLVHQMRGYVIKSTTVKGDFTYEGEDHVLDAFNLALWGFHHQYSLLLTSNYDNKIRFMANPLMENAPQRQQRPQVPILSDSTSVLRDPELPEIKDAPRAKQFNLPSWGKRTSSFQRGFRRQL